ncbi:hypothetical protein ACQR1W_07915 [Bradyrhizobium sp. HKCCYLS1011]|uniref:hypothetical protein n=1 Tax=Bradyrhizobium sp. HKCCYLS1011 TaxID=3420733 RepID=UPI003EB710EE
MNRIVTFLFDFAPRPDNPAVLNKTNRRLPHRQCPQKIFRKSLCLAGQRIARQLRNHVRQV